MRFSHVSKIEKNEGEMTEELTTRRRWVWPSTISHDDLTEDKLESERFVIGTLCLARLPNAGINLMLTGSWHYISDTKKLRQVDPQLDADRAERRKKQQEISEKVKKLNEPGETVESIFWEI